MKKFIKNTSISLLAISFAFSPLYAFAEGTEQSEQTEGLSVQQTQVAIPPVCDPNLNLVKNGGFEDVSVTHQDKWQIFPWGTASLGWESTATKYGLEIQAGLKADDVLPWAPFEGNQYAEIDGGLDVPVMNKFATVVGTKYKISFAYSPRPQQTIADNTISLYWNGSLVADVSDDSNNMNTVWTTKQYEFVATTSDTILSFVDKGADNNPSGYGMFIDSVSVKCVAENNGGPVVPPANTPPVLTLIGENPMTIVVNTPFVDPGATSTDAEDGDLTSQIQKSGTVNASSTGSYTISYTVADSKGSSVTVNRVVNVVPKTITHSCMLPSVLGDTTVESVMPGPGSMSLQDVITAKGYGLNVINDQKQFQVWNTGAGTASITVEYIHRDAVLDAAFGYSTSSIPGSFVPVFRNGPATDYPTAPLKNVGDTTVFNLPTNSEISFGINVGSGINYSTKNSNNSSSEDHVVVYEIDNNVYLVAFEDLSLSTGDKDYNDLVVKITLNSCDTQLGGQCPLSIDNFVEKNLLTYKTHSSSNLSMFTPTSGIGGELDLSLTVAVGNNSVVDTNSINNMLSMSNDSLTKSTLKVVWDGNDNNAQNINYTGLNGFDLTQGNRVDRIEFVYRSDFVDNAKVPVTFTVYSGANNASKATIDLYGANGVDVKGHVLLSSLIPFIGSGANLNNIGAIEMTIDATSRTGHDFSIGKITLPCSGVVVNTPPTITLVGANPIEIFVNTLFVDPGATANDAEDGNLTSAIVKTGTVNASTTGTYTLTYTVTDSGGLSASTTRTVIVKPQGGGPLLPSVNLTGNPSTITVGATTTLSWTSNNTTSCSAAWTSASSTSGSAILSPATTTTYSITCTGAGGNATSTTTIIVNPVNNPDPKPTVTLTANPSTINTGGSSTLSWGSTNATSCSAAWTTATSTSGTALVTPGATTDYSISCTGVGGSASATTTVTANTGGGGGGGGGGSSLSGGRRHPIPQGEILGAATCSYLKDYLKIDWKNDPIEVFKLQLFLKNFEGFSSLPVTGKFDQVTFDAVSTFQNRYKADILTPWGHTAPTGFVYILTKKKVNEIYCQMPFPVTEAQQQEIDAFRAFLASVGGDQGGNYRYTPVSSVSVGASDLSKAVIIDLNNTATSSVAKEKVLDNSVFANAKGIVKGISIRNAAVSLFAFPGDTSNRLVCGAQLISTQCILLFLILLVLLYIVSILLSRSKTGIEKTKRKLMTFIVGALIFFVLAILLSLFCLALPLFVALVIALSYLVGRMGSHNSNSNVIAPVKVEKKIEETPAEIVIDEEDQNQI